MLPSPESAKAGDGTLLAERVDALAVRIQEMDSRVRATEIATGDEKTAKELRKAIEVLAKHDPRLEERLTNRVDVLADRLSTLSTTVSTTAARLAGKDGEIVRLRRELESGHARIEVLVADVRRTAGATDIDELRRAVAAVSAERLAHHDDKQVAGLTRKVEFLAERVDTLASTVATTAAGLAGREGELSALRRRLEDDTSQVTRAVAELEETRRKADFAPEVSSLSSAVATTARDLVRREYELTELRGRLEDGFDRVDSAVAGLGQALGAAASRIDRVEATLAAGAEREIEIAALGRRFEHASASVDGLVEDLRQAIATMPGSGAEATAVESELAELEQSVSALGQRLGQLEERALLETAERQSAGPAELDSLERSDGPAMTPSAPFPGDGRFRMELRALELRMEHAEAAAREHREAVLTQLERLASRVEWRLQRLEPERPTASDDHNNDPVGAQVVPIRGTDP